MRSSWKITEEAEGGGAVLAADSDHRAGETTEEKRELLPGAGHRRRTPSSSSYSKSLTPPTLKDRPEKGEAGAPNTDPGPEGAPKEKGELIHTPDYQRRTWSTDLNCIRSTTTSLKDQSRGFERWKKLDRKKSLIWGLLILVVVLTVVVLALSVLCVKKSNAPACKCPSCPNKWTKYDDICYFVSKNSTGWSESSLYCNKEGGSLLILNDTVQQQIEELFLLRHDHWIGLQKDSKSKKWKWVNGLIYRDSVRVGDDPRMNCAYINSGIGALDCTSSRPWICMKSLWSGHIGGGETD